MEIVLFIVGIIFSSIGIFIIWESNNFKKRATSAMGTVAAMQVKLHSSKNSQQSEVYAPIVQYEFNGEKHQFTARVASSAISHEIGENVQILVDTLNPSSARLAKSSATALGYIFALVGLAMTIGFFFMFDFSAFSIGIAAFVILTLFVQIIVKLRRHGILSLDDMKAEIEKRKKLGINAAYDTYTDNKTDNKTSKMADNSAKIITDQAAFNRHTAQSKKVPAWLPSLFLLVGVAAIAGGVYLTIERLSFLETAVHSQGEIVDFIGKTSTTDDGTTTTYYPVVVYTPYESDERIRFQHDVGSSNPGYQTGQAVDVLYSPTDYNEAIIDEGWMNYFGPIFLILFGAIFSFVAIIAFKQQKKMKKQQKEQNELTLDI